MTCGTATQFFTRGLWARVVLSFMLAGSAAHEINPNARTLRSIGMASFELRDYVSALRALSAALVETRKPLSLDQRTHAQGLLERSRMYVGIYTLKISPADARVLIDGRAPDSEPDGTVLLGFGSHGGERKELAVTLERTPALAVRSGAPGAVGQPPPAEKVFRPGASGGSSGAAWFFAAGGAAALVSGGAGYLWWFENNELKRCHPPDGRTCNNGSAITSRRNLALGTTLAAGAAAVTMAVIGILSLDPGPSLPAAKSALACTVSFSGFLCAKTF